MSDPPRKSSVHPSEPISGARTEYVPCPRCNESYMARHYYCALCKMDHFVPPELDAAYRITLLNAGPYGVDGSECEALRKTLGLLV